MEYGRGVYLSKKLKYEGTVSFDTKLYLKDNRGNEITATFIPVEKIELIKMHVNRLEIRVFPSIVSSFTAYIIMGRKPMKRLADDIANRVNLKKRFLFNEWRGIPYIR
ncbi:MAG: hypothetical protein AVO38_16275 [delta proteobacterium ML8_D]|nr:MAG: hypothetical protein AVO38_16275 [delta proteobacterium ML8_D]